MSQLAGKNSPKHFLLNMNVKAKKRRQLHGGLAVWMRNVERIALTQGMDVGECLLWIIKFTATLRRSNDE